MKRFCFFVNYKILEFKLDSDLSCYLNIEIILKSVQPFNLHSVSLSRSEKNG